MSESDVPRADAAPTPPASAGELLRAARERQGIHLAVLAASLKVAQRKLELMESNRYDELPGATFVRSLALSMCRALKIDAEPVLARLPQPVAMGLDRVSLGLNAPFRDRGGRTDAPAWQRLLNLPLLAAALLVVASIVIYQLPPDAWSRGARMLSSTAGSAPDAAPSSVTEAASAAGVGEAMAPQPEVNPPLSVDAPALAVQELPSPAQPDAAADKATLLVASAVLPDTALASVSAAPELAAAQAIGLLGLRTAGESWIEVRDRNGQLLLSRMLNAGEAVGLDGAVPLRLTVGNVGVTQVTFRGQPVALDASTRDNVARLELK